MAVSSYDEFKIKLANLSDWNPSTHYISKDLSIKEKPRKHRYFNFIFALFRRSKASQVVTAANSLREATYEYEFYLKKDKAATCQIDTIIRKIEDILVKGRTSSNRSLQNTEKKTRLANLCDMTHERCEELLFAPSHLTTSSSSKGQTSYDSDDWEDKCWADLPPPPSQPTIPLSSRRIQQIGGSAQPIDFKGGKKISDEEFPDSDDNFDDVTSSSTPATQSPTPSISLPRLNNPKDLAAYLEKIFKTLPSQQEATALFEALNKRLQERDGSKLLKSNDGPSLNNALQIALSVKNRYERRQRSPEFKKAQLTFCTLLRKKFFAERLCSDAEDLRALQTKFEQQQRESVRRLTGNSRGEAELRELDEKNQVIVHLLDEWTNKLKKGKPIAIPKWFHCTKPAFVNEILKGSRIENRHNGAYPGAFASSVPEMGAMGYGTFCFALSSNIERQTITEAQKTNIANPFPLITNVNADNNYPIHDDREHAPIFIQRRKPNVKTDQEAVDRKPPKVWAGFRADITLEKGKKLSNPLSYYAHTNFSFFAHMLRNDDEFEKQLSEGSLAKLHQMDVRILTREQFDTVIALVNATFHFHLPAEWKDAELIGSFNIKGAQGFNHFPTAYVPRTLKDAKGVRVA
ncbi:hypothetical protein PHSC3_001233 [Chlamydiales bacterium STE3]|nr:hypothetical protein PHSC3_001233 [Chlamydiales bacterium STE3]